MPSPITTAARDHGLRSVLCTTQYPAPKLVAESTTSRSMFHTPMPAMPVAMFAQTNSVQAAVDPLFTFRNLPRGVRVQAMAVRNSALLILSNSWCRFQSHLAAALTICVDQLEALEAGLPRFDHKQACIACFHRNCCSTYRDSCSTENTVTEHGEYGDRSTIPIHGPTFRAASRSKPDGQSLESSRLSSWWPCGSG